MITLSTCRTQEDHAEGNYWSDRFGNPEHRIDKIGELVAIRPADAQAGVMFWLSRNTLSGSYSRFSALSRSYFCGP